MCLAPGTWPLANSTRERTSRITGATPESMRVRSASALIRSAGISVQDAHGLADEGRIGELPQQEVRNVGARDRRQWRAGTNVLADAIGSGQPSVGEFRRADNRPVHEAVRHRRFLDLVVGHFPTQYRRRQPFEQKARSVAT